MQRRRRRIYVPRSLAFMSAARTVVLSAVGDLKVKRTAKRYMGELEDEMSASLPAGESKPSKSATG